MNPALRLARGRFAAAGRSAADLLVRLAAARTQLSVQVEDLRA
ncbi:hypothetical protein [Streptomyces sp. BR123]|nr:hypothetical protein [Streptomyces sp. BR123]